MFAGHTLGTQEEPVVLGTSLKVDLGFRFSFVDPRPPFGQGPRHWKGREGKRKALYSHTNTQIRGLAHEDTVTPTGLPTASMLLTPHRAKNIAGTSTLLAVWKQHGQGREPGKGSQEGYVLFCQRLSLCDLGAHRPV